MEDGAVIRCPECATEIDVDEDEVEEGEILSCPECESELEVSQTHPVHLNIISDEEEDDDDDDDEETVEVAENGDLLDEEEEEEELDEEGGRFSQWGIFSGWAIIQISGGNDASQTVCHHSYRHVD